MLKAFLSPKPLSNEASFGILILRVGIALLMIPHGHEKFYTLISGGGSDFPDPLGVGNQLSLALTVFAEFICSILLLLGLVTRLAVVVLMICMVVIIFVIHANDPFSDKEHPLLYLIPYITIFLTGAGKYSVDEKLF